MLPSEIQTESTLPILLPLQTRRLSTTLRRSSRIASRSVGDNSNTYAISSSKGNNNNNFQADLIAFANNSRSAESVSHSEPSFASSSFPKCSSSIAMGTIPSEETISSRTLGVSTGTSYSSPLTWLSKVITKAGQDERLHYHPNGQHQHSHHRHHHHHHHHHHSRGLSQTSGILNGHAEAPLNKQLFSKATVVTLEKKYATVPWAAEFYCTITSPFFALPVLLYLDPTFQWSAPDIHITHFTIALSVFTAMTSMLYHATLFKIFSSLDACFATVMFYLNTLALLRSLPEPYAMMVPELISSIVQWDATPYVMAVGMISLFILSWKRTAMLSLMLMVLMIPATIWGFIVHESWIGLGFGLLGLSMFAADRFHFFCGHSYWHLAGGLSLWYGIASGALAK